MRWRVTGLAICITSASVANGYQESLTPDVMALHRAVFELPESQILPDGERAQALGRLYAEGNGVLRDPVMACTLFDLAERALMMKAPPFFEGLRLQQNAKRLKAQYCDPLSPIERQWAFISSSCAVFDLPRGTTVDVGPGWWVEFVAADMVRIEFGGKEYEHRLTSGLLCPSSHVVLFRHTMLENARAANSPRHLLEIAAWRPGCCGQVGTRVFTWRAFELSRGNLNLIAQQHVTEPGSIWPVPAIPGGGGAEFSLLDSGDVEYQITLDVLRRGRIPR